MTNLEWTTFPPTRLTWYRCTRSSMGRTWSTAKPCSNLPAKLKGTQGALKTQWICGPRQPDLIWEEISSKNRVVEDWNKIPLDVRKAKTVISFKNGYALHRARMVESTWIEEGVCKKWSVDHTFSLILAWATASYPYKTRQDKTRPADHAVVGGAPHLELGLPLLDADAGVAEDDGLLAHRAARRHAHQRLTRPARQHYHARPW